MQRIRKMKGFTLIELIVVVIIIGVLAAVSAIAYNKFVGDAKAKTALANAKNVAQKLSAEAASNADGNTLAYVAKSTLADLNTATGIDTTTVTLSANAGALTTTSGTAGTVTELKVATGTHGCVLSLGEVAYIKAGSCN